MTVGAFSLSFLARSRVRLSVALDHHARLTYNASSVGTRGPVLPRSPPRHDFTVARTVIRHPAGVTSPQACRRSSSADVVSYLASLGERDTEHATVPIRGLDRAWARPRQARTQRAPLPPPRVAGHPWSRLLADHDLLAGRIWVLVLLTLLIGPAVAGFIRQRARGDRAKPLS